MATGRQGRDKTGPKGRRAPTSDVWLLATIMGSSVIVAVSGWLLLSLRLSSVGDRASVSVAIATLLLAATTVWATVVGQREARRYREYEAHVSLQPEVVSNRAGDRPDWTAPEPWTARPMAGAHLDFRNPGPSGDLPMGDVARIRFALSVSNFGRGPAHSFRLSRSEPTSSIVQQPVAMVIGSSREVELRLSFTGFDATQAPRVVLTFDYEDAFGTANRLEVDVRRYRVWQADASFTEQWGVAEFRVDRG